MINKNILFIGCGKMGGALLNGLLEKNVVQDSNIFIVKKNKEVSQTKLQNYNLNIATSFDAVPDDFAVDIVILAVKPQILPNTLVDIQNLNQIHKNTVFISIAAGTTISNIEDTLGNYPIIRSMPNLPVTIGKGVTVAIANKNITPEIQNTAQEIFESVGDFHWVNNENLMDHVTAISGSGPAYIFYFIEALIKAGTNLGLTEELAKSLALSTIIGSSELARNSNSSALELREQVTSPNGTTYAALSVLTKDDLFATIVEEAVKAASERSKELSH